MLYLIPHVQCTLYFRFSCSRIDIYHVPTVADRPRPDHNHNEKNGMLFTALSVAARKYSLSIPLSLESIDTRGLRTT
jgi:hypothetical protein